MTSLLMVFCNALLWTTIKPGRPPYSLRMFIFYSAVVFIGYVVIWFYWSGRNWARIAVFITSAFNILNLLEWNRLSLSPALLTTPAHINLTAKAVLSVALLYWLNTRAARAFFTGSQRVAP